MKRPLSVALTLLVACFGCSPPAAPARHKAEFTVVLRASTDQELPLAGVAATLGKLRVSDTGPAGTSTAHLSGDEGQTLSVAVKCPDGFLAPPQPSPLRLTNARALASSKTEPLTYDVTCNRKTRDIIVAVKTTGTKAAVPILVDGRPRGATDESGVAHVALSIDSDSPSLRVELDTTADPALLPPSPSRTFALNGKDSILVLEQAFSRRSRPKLRPTTPPQRHIPQRLN